MNLYVPPRSRKVTRGLYDPIPNIKVDIMVNKAVNPIIMDIITINV